MVSLKQPSKELGMQPRGVLVIDGDIRGIQDLDKAPNEVKNLRLIIGFYQPRELRPQELEQESRCEGREDEVTCQEVSGSGMRG